MFEDVSARIDRLVEDLLRGRRLRATNRDAVDREAIMTAAELAAAREGYPRMSPAFRRRLTATLMAANHPGPPGGIMQTAGGRWVEVAALSQLTEAKPTRVVAGNLVAYLFRNGSTVTGVSGICSHLPCVLSWKAEGGLLACPCHPVNFLPSGESTAENYVVEPLPKVLVKVEQEKVFVFSG